MDSQAATTMSDSQIAAAMSDSQATAEMPDSETADLLARVTCLEAEARQRDEDHMMHVMELSGRIREYVQKLDVSEADASQLRVRLRERERQLEQRSSFESESLHFSGGSSGEELSQRLVFLEARSMEHNLEQRKCEEEHAARELELTGHIRDLAKRTDHAEAELDKLRKQLEDERANHIHLQIERENLIKSLREQLDALSQENFRLGSDLARCMEELRKMASERPFLCDRRLVTQGLCVYFEQRDPTTRAEVFARLADMLEFTSEERQRLEIVQKLPCREQQLLNAEHSNKRRHAVSDLANQFIRFISAEVDEPSALRDATPAGCSSSALTGPCSGEVTSLDLGDSAGVSAGDHDQKSPAVLAVCSEMVKGAEGVSSG